MPEPKFSDVGTCTASGTPFFAEIKNTCSPLRETVARLQSCLLYIQGCKPAFSLRYLPAAIVGAGQRFIMRRITYELSVRI